MFLMNWLKWLESNVVSIVLALMLALTVWIIATQENNPIQQVEFDQSVPVEQVGLGDNLLITNNPTMSVTIEVRASQNTLRTLSVDDFTVTADLSGLEPGVHNVPLQAHVNAQAIIVSIIPSQIEVELEEIAERERPIQLLTEGSPPTGYEVGDAILEPAAALVRGPRSQVDLVSEVQVNANIDSRRDTYIETLPLTAINADGDPITTVSVRPQSVTVTIPIVQEADFKEVAVRVDGNFQPAPGYYISRWTTEPLLVPIRGDVEVIQDVSFIETQRITLEGLTEDQQVTAQLLPPEGVTLEGVQTVQVFVFVDAQPGFKVLEVPVQVTGLAEDLTANVTPETIGVFLSGPSPILDALNEQENVLASVDVSDLEPGSYQLEPFVELTSGEIPTEELERLVVESVVPTLVNVEISLTAEGTR